LVSKLHFSKAHNFSSWDSLVYLLICSLFLLLRDYFQLIIISISCSPKQLCETHFDFRKHSWYKKWKVCQLCTISYPYIVLLWNGNIYEPFFFLHQTCFAGNDSWYFYSQWYKDFGWRYPNKLALQAFGFCHLLAAKERSQTFRENQHHHGAKLFWEKYLYKTGSSFFYWFYIFSFKNLTLIDQEILIFCQPYFKYQLSWKYSVSWLFLQYIFQIKYRTSITERTHTWREWR